MHLLEVPVFSPPSADLAIRAGAHGIELNRAGSYPQGGLTPSLADLEALSPAAVPVRVMIRPRGPPPPPTTGAPDFIYSDDEFEEMRGAVRMFAACGLLQSVRADGLVFGVLRRRPGGEGLVVDVERNAELVRLAGGLPCVFHRAFDDILGTHGSTIEEALSDLAKCGFHGLLTSGGPGTAAEHAGELSAIIKSAHTRLKEVIIGGGVRSTNVEALRQTLPEPEGVEVLFHSSCLTRAAEASVVDEYEVRAILDRLA